MAGGIAGGGVSGVEGAAPEFAMRVKAKHSENKCFIIGIKLEVGGGCSKD